MAIHHSQSDYYPLKLFVILFFHARAIGEICDFFC